MPEYRHRTGRHDRGCISEDIVFKALGKHPTILLCRQTLHNSPEDSQGIDIICLDTRFASQPINIQVKSSQIGAADFLSRRLGINPDQDQQVDISEAIRTMALRRMLLIIPASPDDQPVTRQYDTQTGLFLACLPPNFSRHMLQYPREFK